jgi:hypothetical protein
MNLPLKNWINKPLLAQPDPEHAPIEQFQKDYRILAVWHSAINHCFLAADPLWTIYSSIKDGEFNRC